MPKKQGFLVKRGGLVTNWKKRLFYLTKSELYYFKGETLNGMPQGSIELRGATCTRSTMKPHCMQIVTPDRTFYAYSEQGQTPQERETYIDSWIRIVCETIDELNISKQRLRSLAISEEDAKVTESCASLKSVSQSDVEKPSNQEPISTPLSDKSQKPNQENSENPTIVENTEIVSLSLSPPNSRSSSKENENLMNSTTESVQLRQMGKDETFLSQNRNENENDEKKEEGEEKVGLVVEPSLPRTLVNAPIQNPNVAISEIQNCENCEIESDRLRSRENEICDQSEIITKELVSHKNENENENRFSSSENSVVENDCTLSNFFCGNEISVLSESGAKEEIVSLTTTPAKSPKSDVIKKPFVPQLTEDLQRFMHHGTFVLKFPFKKGKPSKKFLQLSSDGCALKWGPNKRLLNKSVKIVDVRWPVFGPRSANFRKCFPDVEGTNRCFSIVCIDRTLDVQCESREHCENWFMGLQALLFVNTSQGKRQVLSRPRLLCKMMYYSLVEKARKENKSIGVLVSQAVIASTQHYESENDE